MSVACLLAQRFISVTELKGNACHVILAHNHSFQGSESSHVNINLIKGMVADRKFLDIPVPDHVTLTSETYDSFADEALF